MRSRFGRFFLISFLFIFAVSFSNPLFANRDEIRDINLDKSLRNLDRKPSGNFPVANDFERAVSAGLGADAKPGESVPDAINREREEIDEHYDSHDWSERKHVRDQLKAADDTKADEEARKDRLAKLDRASLDRARVESQQAIDYFNKMNGPSDKWTLEQNERYNQLVYKNAILTQPTAAESKEAEKHEQVRRDVYNEIKAAAYTMGKMTDDEVRERLQAAQTADALTKTWRDFTFTGQMYNQVHQDIFNQHELGIKANSMMIAAQLYLRQPGLSLEQKKIAQQILDSNKMVRGHAADAISKDAALVILGATCDVGLMGIGKAVSKAVGAIGGWVSGGTKAGTGAAPAAAGSTGEAAATGGKVAGTEGGVAAGGKAAGTEGGATAGAKAAGTEAGAEAGAKAAGQEAGQGVKPPSQMSASEAQAYQDQLSNKGISNVKDAGQKIADIAKDKTVVMPPEAGAAAAETKAIEGSVKNLTQAQIDKLFEKGANLTPNQVIQKAELLKQGYNPAAGGGASGATVGGGQQASGATQGFNKVLPLPGQGAGNAAGGTTQAFNGAITLPHPPPTAAVSGGATQAFKGVMPIPGGGGATAASEAATVSGNLTGNAAGGTTQAFNGAITLPYPPPTAAVSGGATQAFKGVMPIPGGGGATAASEAATVSGNLTGNAAGGATQGFKGVLPIPGGGGGTAASEAPTVAGNLAGKSVPPGVNPGGVASESATVKGNLIGGKK